MGLFDYVHSEVSLPDGYSGECQTKDFDCPYMEHYTITKAGRLVKRIVEREEPVPESEWRFSADDPDPINRLRHHQSKTTNIYAERDENYHGMLNFYGGCADEWHEYNAKFTDGKLVEIQQVQAERSRAFGE